ncbi:MAG: TIGR02757 family protein, partial [Myxococcota bacterium]
TELDRLLRSVDRAALVAGDPISLVRAYDDPHDQEVAGLLVAMLAYGRVASIKAKASQALQALAPSPARAVEDGRRLRRLQGFVYRFQKNDDVPRFLRAIGRVRRRYGSLGRTFASLAASGPPEPTYVTTMERFVATIADEIEGELTYGLRYLLPRTSGQGAAKRLCLYLRWMIRPDDGVDLGTWTALGADLDPARLIMPLDTHIARIGRYLRLTKRATNDLRTALDITEHLRALAPRDPLRYDMALCHLGISGACPQRRDPQLCEGCGLRRVCRLGPTPVGWSNRE